MLLLAVGSPLGLDSIEQQVITFLTSKAVTVNSQDIDACNPLQCKSKTEKPSIIICFLSTKQKIAMLQQGRKPRGIDVYRFEMPLAVI